MSSCHHVPKPFSTVDLSHLPVVWNRRPAMLGLHLPAHEVVALRHGAPHARILWSQEHGTAVVEQRVVVQASHS